MKTLSTMLFTAMTGIAGGAHAAALSVSTEMQPSQVRLGEDAELDITVNGEVARPQIPNVPGLSIQPAGQSRQVSIVNGAVSTQVSYAFIVSAERVGHFTVPALRIGNAMSAPAELAVVDAAAPPTAANRSRQAWLPKSPQIAAANPVPQNANEQLVLGTISFEKLETTIKPYL